MNPATTTVNGTCHHDCPDSCGWTVTVDHTATDAGPVAVKLRGNPDHPYSYGELCPKVNPFLDRVPAGFMREMTREEVERVAADKGVATIDLAVCEEGIGHARETMNEVIAGYVSTKKPR